MENLEMDPAVARQATENLNTVLFLDVPKGTLFGIDLNVFTIDDGFRGVKMIPDGLHFFSTSSTNQHHGLAPPVSWFVILDQSTVLVRRWSLQNEQLEQLTDEDEEHRFKLGVSRFDFDSQLAPYDLPKWRTWKRLSSWINQKTIDRIMGTCQFITLPEEGVSDALSASIPSEAALLDQLQDCDEEKQPLPKLQYTYFPNLIKKQGLTASELTNANLDMTGSLKEILYDAYDDQYEDLLGELQFSFTAFLFGQSLLSLEQWKLMIHLLFRCYDGLTDKSLEKLFVGFLRTVRSQISFILSEESADAKDLLDSSFLKSDIIQLLNLSRTEELKAPIKQQCIQIGSLLQDSLGWIINSDEDQYAPVVVDIQECFKID